MIDRDTAHRRENDRIDLGNVPWRIVVELELENLPEPWAREAYLWHRVMAAIDPAKTTTSGRS